MTAKTTAERQRAFRADLKRQGLTEVRGIFAKPAQHQAIKEAAKQMLDSKEKTL
jgi:DNA-binding LacI/PurR family transcriptional regulator